jgi:hypothetical protein
MGWLLADLNADSAIRASRSNSAVLTVPASTLKPRALRPKASIGACASSRLIAPKSTKPMPLGASDVIFPCATQASTAPQLSRT